jgi:hypothetical protein
MVEQGGVVPDGDSDPFRRSGGDGADALQQGFLPQFPH